MEYFWLILFILLLVAEFLTAGLLISIWFSIGALGAYIVSRMGLGLTAQLIVFIVISVVLLVLTKPFLKKFITPKVVPTNFDMLIGKVGIVTEDIDNLSNVGEVTINGKVWSALSNNGGFIIAGSRVRILEIRGVKLVVESMEGEFIK